MRLRQRNADIADAGLAVLLAGFEVHHHRDGLEPFHTRTALGDIVGLLDQERLDFVRSDQVAGTPARS